MRKGRRLVSPPPPPHHPTVSSHKPPHCFSEISDNYKLFQVVPVVVTKIDTFIDLGVKCLEGTTERSDGNRVRSARIGEVRTMCLEGTTPQDM